MEPTPEPPKITTLETSSLVFSAGHQRRLIIKGLPGHILRIHFNQNGTRIVSEIVIISAEIRDDVATQSGMYSPSIQ